MYTTIYIHFTYQIEQSVIKTLTCACFWITCVELNLYKFFTLVVCHTAHKIIKPALCTYLCHKVCYLLTITFYLSWGQIPNIQIQLRKIVQNKNEINTCFPLCSSDPSKNRQPAVSVDIFLPVIYIRFNQNPKLQLISKKKSVTCANVYKVSQ